jgi:hypothetical protein
MTFNGLIEILENFSKPTVHKICRRTPTPTPPLSIPIPKPTLEVTGTFLLKSFFQKPDENNNNKASSEGGQY